MKSCRYVEVTLYLVWLHRSKLLSPKSCTNSWHEQISVLSTWQTGWIACLSGFRQKWLHHWMP